MKKSLLVFSMALIMSGSLASPKLTRTVSAEDKLPTPHEVNQREVHLGHDDDTTAIDYPWEWFTANLDGKGTPMADLAELEIALYPYEDGFNAELAEGESKTYATITHTSGYWVLTDAIVTALKGVFADPTIEYSPAFRYVSKVEEYTNSDWYVQENNIHHKYDFDFSLDIIMENIFKVDETSGKLIWPTEIFTANPQSSEIDHIQVLVFPGDTEEINEESKPLITFDIHQGDPETSAEIIQKHLTNANLKTGEYKFSIRLIPTKESKYTPSHLYPLTEAFEYTPEDLSVVNVAKECKAYASYGDANAAVDGNQGSRWINNEADTGWLLIDLGERRYLSNIKIHWEGAFAKDFEVFLEDKVDPSTFDGDTSKMTPVVSVKDRGEFNEFDDFKVNETKGVSGQYIIINCIEKGSVYNFSIWEVEAYVNADLTEAQKFEIDWLKLRAAGGKDGICAAKDSEEMKEMLARYDALEEEDKLALDGIDDAMGVSIGDTIRYLKSLTELKNTTTEGSLSSLLLSVSDNEKSYSLIAIFAGIALMTVLYYYYASKKKYNN